MVATRSVGVVCADLELGAVRDVGGLVVHVRSDLANEGVATVLRFWIWMEVVVCSSVGAVVMGWVGEKKVKGKREV
ncbi:hypothetical protein glysoja_016397 [Glycine soja]|nr:hypothetical protein glysoja_016397 [Glycine soja]